MIEKLQLVFIVKNKSKLNKFGFIYTLKYTAAMVELLQWYQQKSVNLIYGFIGKSLQFITKNIYIYSLAYIMEEAHVILAILLPVQY